MPQMESLFQETNADTAPESVQVLVPYPVDKAYSYSITADCKLNPGDYVTVPLGNREVPGVVWDPVDQPPAKKLKDVITAHDLPPLPQDHRDFIKWIARYTMTPIGFVLKMTMSAPAGMEEEKPVTGYRLANAGDKEKLSPQRQRVLDVMKDGKPRRAQDIARLADCTPAVIRGMVEKFLLEPFDIPAIPPCAHPDHQHGGVNLSGDQKKAADSLAHRVREGKYHVSLLDGVTGAGKTEVYFEAVAEALKQDKQALILLPEIALSNAFLDRFEARFGCKPALWHSGLTPAQRRKTWRGVAEGQTKVVVGARSALMLPYQSLALIVIDEEHDPAYKQEDNVIYNARDMAIVRAHLGQFPVVLVSATPSLETMVNTWDGKYEHLKLPDRHGEAVMPDVHMIDMRKERPERGSFLSPILIKALLKTFEKNEQSLLFLNRRGYAPLTLCRTCGHRLACPRCTSWLVEHRKTLRLHCHHCGYSLPHPDTCPSCDDKDSLHACGPGVERIQEEVQNLFPQARIAVIASDLMETDTQLRETLADIKDHKYDMIIGTQIIAKGHHFPKLTCVGVVDADLGLGGGDLRAAERTFQLLHQVAGRAGREDLRGHVYLQSFVPDNKVMQALLAHERDLFYEVEAEEREAAFMPPYSRLAGIIVAGKDEPLVEQVAAALGKTAPFGDKIQTFGPAEAPYYRLRGTYRRRLLVRADKNVNLQKTLKHWIDSHNIPSTVRVYIDIDPQSFL